MLRLRTTALRGSERASHGCDLKRVTQQGNDLKLAWVERATGPLRRATRPPLCMRQPSTNQFEHVRAEARRQVAAENGRVARSTLTFAHRSDSCPTPLLKTHHPCEQKSTLLPGFVINTAHGCYSCPKFLRDFSRG